MSSLGHVGKKYMKNNYNKILIQQLYLFATSVNNIQFAENSKIIT